ncbi:MAG TPA: hypothetical protein VN257_10425, partial [Actinotalea sp.]|nr:hypothetical protein [Actinotalea sp.]
RSAGGAAVLRRATRADLPAVTALQEGVQAGFDVAVPHPPARRRWLLEHDASTTWVLERSGAVVATARVSASADEPVVAEAAALDAAAATTLLDALAATTPGQVHVVHRAGTVTAAAWGPRLGPASDDADQYYVRTARPERVLDALRPVLHRRLAAADLLGTDRDLVVSTFRRHYRLPLTAQGIGPIGVGGPMQAPGVVGGAGVAPDHVPALLLGPEGLRGLARRHTDVYPGPQAATYEALFPPLTADLLTYYLPW